MIEVIENLPKKKLERCITCIGWDIPLTKLPCTPCIETEGNDNYIPYLSIGEMVKRDHCISLGK